MRVFNLITYSRKRVKMWVLFYKMNGIASLNAFMSACQFNSTSKDMNFVIVTIVIVSRHLPYKLESDRSYSSESLSHF